MYRRRITFICREEVIFLRLQLLLKSKYIQFNHSFLFQLMNYEKEYEKFFCDVLESKGRSIQRKHFQSLTKPQEVKK